MPHYFAYYFLMKKKLLLFLTLLAFSSAAHLSAQKPVSWRVRHLTADSLTLRIDTLSVNPQIFHIQGVNKSQYRLDPLTATLYLLDSNLLGQRLFLEYEVYSLDFSKPMAHKSSQSIEPHRVQHEFLEYPVPTLDDVLNSSELR